MDTFFSVLKMTNDFYTSNMGGTYMYVGGWYSVPNPGMTTHLCFDGYYDIFLCLQDIFYIKRYIPTYT